MIDVSVAILHKRSRYQKGEQGNLCPRGLTERVRIEWDVCAQNRLFLWLRGAPLSLLIVFGEAALFPCTTHQPGGSHGRGSLVGCSPWGRWSRTRLGDFTFTFHFHALEKEVAAHSSVLAWRIPGTGKPGGLPSMWSHRVGHD